MLMKELLLFECPISPGEFTKFEGKYTECDECYDQKHKTEPKFKKSVSIVNC